MNAEIIEKLFSDPNVRTIPILDVLTVIITYLRISEETNYERTDQTTRPE